MKDCVRRDEFVSQCFAGGVDELNKPLHGEQSIRQPYIVAFMSDAAQIRPGARCLEIGTRSDSRASWRGRVSDATGFAPCVAVLRPLSLETEQSQRLPHRVAR